MSDHIGDSNKMVSDTPKTDAAYFKPGTSMYDLAGDMKRLERELNAANARIKQLEDRIERASIAFFHDGSDRQTAVGMLSILEEERTKP